MLLWELKNVSHFGHLYLSGVWLGVDLRHDTKKACVWKRDEVTVRSEFVNYSRFNNQHIPGDPCGRFNKTFI